jgi:hypothetical protein
MKEPKPELYNNRVIWLAGRFVSSPFRLVAAVYRLICRVVRGCRSDESLHAADQLRQSRARRTLRGLPPDHVQASSKSA